MSKAVVQFWSQSIPQPIGMGIGDFIRGTMRLYQLSKLLGFDLFVDTDFHSMSAFLEKTPHPYKGQTKAVDFVYLNNLLPYLTKKWHEPVLMISTNEALDENGVTEDCLDFMRNKVLQPNKEFLAFYKKKRDQIPFTEFNVVHFRFGDTYLVKKEEIAQPSIPLLVKTISELAQNGPLVVLSDSPHFRQQIRDATIENVFPLADDISHVGASENSLEALANTFFEYRLLAEAKTIMTYSVYTWFSGFVYYPHLLYNIPLYVITDLKDPMTAFAPKMQLENLIRKKA